MGQPRRRFPGGSVGGFFAICHVKADAIDEVLCAPFLTEGEALTKATEWSEKYRVRAYIAQYNNHVDPPQGH